MMPPKIGNHKSLKSTAHREPLQRPPPKLQESLLQVGAGSLLPLRVTCQHVLPSGVGKAARPKKLRNSSFQLPQPELQKHH